MTARADEYIRNYGFNVEVSGFTANTSPEGKWKSFRGGGLRLHESAGVTTGRQNMQQHTLGPSEWEDIVLTGAVTKDRKDALTWYTDMVNDGGEGKCFKDVTLNLLDRDQSAVMRTIVWNHCFLTAYSLSPLDGDEQDVECMETLEICTGYSEDFLA